MGAGVSTFIAYGLNNFVPASAGNVAQYYLTKNSIRN